MPLEVRQRDGPTLAESSKRIVTSTFYGAVIGAGYHVILGSLAFAMGRNVKIELIGKAASTSALKLASCFTGCSAAKCLVEQKYNGHAKSIIGGAAGGTALAIAYPKTIEFVQKLQAAGSKIHISRFKAFQVCALSGATTLGLGDLCVSAFTGKGL